MRNLLAFVPWKDLKEVVADLKTINSADTDDIALENLDEFAKKWYNRWDQLNTLIGYTKDIRKAIYTTNAIESLNMTLRKVVKNKLSFPNDTAVFKTLYLAIQNISQTLDDADS